jgi:thiosulfate dehydrogenase
MLKALLVGIVVGMVLLFAVVWLYFTGGHAPVATADPPMPFERKLAGSSLHAFLHKQKPVESPIPADEKNLLAGAEVYKQNCAVCHGLPNEAETAIADGMYPKPPELFHGTGVTDDPAWETHWKAENGIRLTGMPGFKGRLTDAQLWQVSQLLATADKIPTSVRVALVTNTPSAATAPPTPQTQTTVRGTK